jgi:uroporphyrin-III C-methyltransferase/precorrin-2 dehydrogenase/sirohydrochlorin ferrochelatase/uroporphyrin-III C-methyltransferase
VRLSPYAPAALATLDLDSYDPLAVPAEPLPGKTSP